VNDLTKDPPLRSVLIFGIPLYIGDFLQQLYVFVDSIIVGQVLGTNALAAIGVSQPVFFLLQSIFMGVSIGFSIYIAHQVGGKNFTELPAAIGTLLVATVVMSVLSMAIGGGLVSDLLKISHVPDSLITDGTLFLRYLLLGILPIFVLNALGGILRGLGDSKSPLVMFICGSILNIVFELLFVVVLHFGIVGAALGTVFSQLLTVLISLAYVFWKYDIDLSHWRLLRFSKSALVKAVKFGMPLSVQYIFLAIGTMILVAIVSPMGQGVIAAFTIVGRLETFTAMPLLGLSSALTTFVAQNYGGSLFRRIREAFWKVQCIGLLVSALISIIVWIYPDFVARIFSNDPAVIDITKQYMAIVYPFFMFYSLMVMMHGSLNGLGRSIVPLVCTFVSFLVIRLPFSYLVKDSLGVPGLIWAVVIGWGVGLFYTLLFVSDLFPPRGDRPFGKAITK